MTDLIPSFWLITVLSFGVSLTTCIVIIAWFNGRKAKPELLDVHAGSVQAVHTQPTPRLGGIAVAVGVCAGVAVAWSVLKLQSSIVWLPLATAVPVFFAGLMEDIYGGVPARVRLIASAAAGILFILSSGYWIQRLDIFGLDWLLAAAPIIAIAFTIFACVGATHAVNLIDGLNGLAGGFAVAASLCLALVAYTAGLQGHVVFLLILAASITGFLVVNFPFGKIFLGDAGAYTIGHALVWTAVSILALADDVSAFALLLIFFWPICDTCFAIARRLYAGQPIGMPDRGHFHHIVYAAVERLANGHVSALVLNSTATLIILPLMVGPIVLAVAVMDNAPLAVMCTAGSAASYIATYFLILRVATKLIPLGKFDSTKTYD